MVFSSLIFLFAYMCVTLPLYFLVPRKWRNIVLFAVSLVFYGWQKPIYIVVMLFSICVAYVCGFFIGKYRESDPKRAKLFLIISLSLNLLTLVFFKYTNFFIENLRYIPFLTDKLHTLEWLELPIGISFYTFQIMSYSIDLYRAETDVQKNFISFGTYVTLFPQLIAGPIVRYRDIDDQLATRRESFDKFASGVTRFCIGLGKKVLLGDSIAAIYEYYKAAAVFDNSVLGAWLIMICFTLHIYYDFSGYSDMAIGLGRMFGFEFLENFNYPYISKSVTEFWRRWHISLSTWFKEYVYIPLGGNRKGKARQYFNLAVVWLLTGFWHGASWNYVLWGVFYLIFLIIEKMFLLKRLEKVPSFISHIYSLLMIGVGFVIFAFKDLSAGFAVIGALFGIGADSLFIPSGAYQFFRALPLLLICGIGVTPLPKKAWERLRGKFKAASYAIPVFTAVILLLCTAYLVDSTFSPFLYFEF